LIAWIGDESDVGMQAIAALVTALIVAGGVYSKQRYDDEKAKRAWYDNGVDRRQADG
jgi:ribonucleotide monophosphatase NagD (HAD superfamily)